MDQRNGRVKREEEGERERVRSIDYRLIYLRGSKYFHSSVWGLAKISLAAWNSCSTLTPTPPTIDVRVTYSGGWWMNNAKDRILQIHSL